MGKLSEIQLKKVLILLWGPPLGGKTVLASQFPQPFFIDLEDGLHSVKALRKKYGGKFDFDAITINENKTVDKDFVKLCGDSFASSTAWTKAKKLTEVLCRKMPQDSTLVIDSASRLYEMLIIHIQKVTGRVKLQIQDWGTFVDELQGLLTDIKYKSKCNVILIGHEEYKEDQASGEIRRSFLMVTKMKERIPSIMTEDLRLYSIPEGPKNKRKIVRKLQTQPDFITAVGSRSLIPDLDNPTYEKMKPYFEDAFGRKLPGATWTPPED